MKRQDRQDARSAMGLGPAASSAAPPSKLTTPYQAALPRQSPEEREALEASIKREGVRVPILVDQRGRILDGHHRYAAARKLGVPCPRQVVKVESDAEAEAAVYRYNLARRNLTPGDWARVLAKMRATAAKLNQAGKPDREIAALLGVGRSTVARWLQGSHVSKAQQRQDARRKLQPTARAAITRRIKAGEKPADVARALGVNRSTVTRLLVKAKPSAKAKRASKPKRCPTCGQKLPARQR